MKAFVRGVCLLVLMSSGFVFGQEKEGEKKEPPKSAFADKKLEEAVRRYVFEKRDNDQPITAEDVKNISTIEAKRKGITNLSGLDFSSCTNIRTSCFSALGRLANDFAGFCLRFSQDFFSLFFRVCSCFCSHTGILQSLFDGCPTVLQGSDDRSVSPSPQDYKHDRKVKDLNE